MQGESDVPPAAQKQPREVVVSDPLICQRIEGYYFEKLLGQGAYGTVYLVVDEKNNRKAIKKIQSNEAHTDLIIVDMHHENVVKYFDHFIVTNHSYDQSTFTFIVTEYCEVRMNFSRSSRHIIFVS